MKIEELLFATSNNGKLAEARDVARHIDLKILGPSVLTTEEGLGYGLEAPLSSPPEVEENASTYLGNARLKADACFDWCGLPCMADDTGLEVDSLDGAPGLYSARYAGPANSAPANIAKLLDDLSGCKDRRASFRCVLCLVYGEKSYLSAETLLEGSKIRGKGMILRA